MRLLKSKFSIVLSGIGLLIGAAVLFLLFTDQPLVKLLRFTVFNAFEFEGELASRGVSKIVAQFLESAQVEFLDLEPAFAGRDLESLLIHPTDYHLTHAGHDLAARAAFAHLKDAFEGRGRAR